MYANVPDLFEHCRVARPSYDVFSHFPVHYRFEIISKDAIETKLILVQCCGNLCKSIHCSIDPYIDPILH